MPDWMQRIVWAVPALGNLAATARGWQINRERYGPVYRKALEEIRRRDTWSFPQLLEYQEEELRRLVRMAVAHVPHYRDVFRHLGLSADDIRGVTDLARLPILEKSHVREDPLRFVDERRKTDELIRDRTSGTTGVPVTVYKTHEALQAHYAFFEVRCRQVAGLAFGKEPYIMFGAQPVVPVTRTRPPFWCYNHVAKQLYMSVFHLAPGYLGAYCREMRRRPYHAVVGYPSSLYAVARHILSTGEEPFRFRCAITSGEVLYPHQRCDIEAAFGCRIFDQYGCSEICMFGSQCAEGSMHLSTDYAVTELVDDNGHPLPPGEPGQLLCTGLLNYGTVLIRYRVGDRGTLGTRPCRCGRSLPVLASLDGREGLQAFVTRDGRRISRVGTVAEGVPHVGECQVVQDDYERYTVRVVPCPGFSEAQAEQIRRNLAESVGQAQIDVVCVDALERTAAGKVLFVTSKVSAGQPMQMKSGVPCCQ